MPTKHAGSDEEQRALNAFIALQRCADSFDNRLQPVFQEFGLTESQFGVLEALLHLGPMCPSELGAKILRSSGNMTMVVDNLEKRGLVERQRVARDRRMVIVHLTSQGRTLAEAAFPAVLTRIVGQLGVLCPAEQEQLRHLCRRLGLQIPSEG